MIENLASQLGRAQWTLLTVLRREPFAGKVIWIPAPRERVREAEVKVFEYVDEWRQSQCRMLRVRWLAVMTVDGPECLRGWRWQGSGSAYLLRPVALRIG